VVFLSQVFTIGHPCVCLREPPPVCSVCGKQPCVCVKEPCPKCGQRPCVCKKKAKVRLADGKERTIQHMTATSFWHPDGTPMSAAQFMEALFGKLPEFFRDEDELRALWSAPDTRDLFDVLAHVAYALAPLTREERAARAKTIIGTHFNSKQQVFLDFVLSHYVSVGVEEIDQAKLTSLLRLKYHDSIADAVADLGRPDEIGKVFSGFQKYLYQDTALNA